MNRSRLHWLVLAFLAFQRAPATQGLGARRDGRAEGPGSLHDIPGMRLRSGRLIARPRQAGELRQRGVGPEEARALREAARSDLGAYRVLRYVPETDETLLEVAPGSEERAIAALLATGHFQYVEPDWIVFPLGAPEPRQSGGATPLAPPAQGGVQPGAGWLAPDDPLLPSQWHHQPGRMNSRAAWARHRGQPTVSIGICDTGVRTTHEDLLLHRLEGYNAVDHLWESQGGAIGPVYSHGTRTTGTAVASGNNGLGVVGVGWNLAHRMVRVSNLSDGGAYLTDLQHGARTSVESGDRVASVSYHGVYFSSNLTTAEYIRSLGGLLVWAAGNSSANFSFSDRDADDLLVVGATDMSDSLAWFSNYGTFIDLVAPGVGILTTDSASDQAYTTADGTSYACPLVAGACALLWSARPTLTPADVERLIKLGADDIGPLGLDATYGHGRIDLANSLGLSGRAVPLADLSATPASGRGPLLVQFRDQSTGVASAWAWDFGDGSGSSTQNPVHTYEASGAYTVSLTVTNALGSDTHVAVDEVLVDIIPPVADFDTDPPTGLSPLTVQFTDRSGGGVPTAWSWDFGDGSTSTLRDPLHVYTTSGSANVTLTASNAYGSSTITHYAAVVIDQIPPVADFTGTPLAGASPLRVDFTDLSGGGVTTQWYWNFGDGTGSVQQHPTHTYTAAGSYAVTLTAVNAYGSDVETKFGYVNVSAGPSIVANFVGTPTSGDAPLTVVFTDLSVGNILTWEWEFGDGTSSTLQNPTHVYTTPDQYNVSLTVTNPTGQDDQLELSNYITVE